MLRFMYSGISGMKVNQNKLDVVGNNIANVSTTAFKSSRAQFTDMLYQNASLSSAPTSNKGGTNAKQVGLGAQLSSVNKVMSQGNALSTGRSLDVCVDGEGYLIVGSGPVNYTDEGGLGIDSTTQGIGTGSDMTINYTRDGNLTLDRDGNLLTSDGHRVMGYLLTDTSTEGNNVHTSIEEDADGTVKAYYVDSDGKLAASIPGTTNAGGNEIVREKLYALKIPDVVYVPNSTGDGEIAEKVASFSIGKDGIITAILANSQKTVLGQIATATFTNPEGLTALGGNLFEVSPNSGSELIQTSINVDEGVTDGSTRDNSKAFGDIIQGCLEASNVDLTEQFTDMISATRCFQASSKLITTGDEILQTITGLLR
ncbi:MAG: flagellar hook-basal body complex protein [bacterium]|nr:flagellar hook-basal body complex protein [bacterium]